MLPVTTVVTDAEMKRRDREKVLAALNQSNWQVHGPGGEAELLGIRPTTLALRIKRMGLRRSS
jgi:transcriptional regulator with GAF, ATPase, and Fis domain